MLITRDADGLRLEWVDDDTAATLRCRHNSAFEAALAADLRRYFAGEAVDFSTVPTPAGPPFFAACWAACRGIPRGETWSYRQLASAAGSPRASRAAGQAMRHNPLPVIIPCHRVCASDGTLHGFGGWSDPSSAALNRKARLLSIEGRSDHADSGTRQDHALVESSGRA